MDMVEHCVSSRWGFTCFSEAQPRGFRVESLNAARIRRLGARGIMVGAGFYFGREVLRDALALPRLAKNGDVGRATLPTAIPSQAEPLVLEDEEATTWPSDGVGDKVSDMADKAVESKESMSSAPSSSAKFTQEASRSDLL
uniref:Uncharacterized protein n=1 Tax=Haptolina ericina TaxID=156174 RepID=A0A7S3FC28_9EUKA